MILFSKKKNIYESLQMTQESLLDYSFLFYDICNSLEIV